MDAALEDASARLAGLDVTVGIGLTINKTPPYALFVVEGQDTFTSPSPPLAFANRD
jgi:hypothetical protein